MESILYGYPTVQPQATRGRLVTQALAVTSLYCNRSEMVEIPQCYWIYRSGFEKKKHSIRHYMLEEHIADGAPRKVGPTNPRLSLPTNYNNFQIMDKSCNIFRFRQDLILDKCACPGARHNSHTNHLGRMALAVVCNGTDEHGNFKAYKAVNSIIQAFVDTDNCLFIDCDGDTLYVPKWRLIHMYYSGN